MKWKFDRINWHRYGNCWRWTQITKQPYYSGNVIAITWGRITVWFERRKWITTTGTTTTTPNQ